MTRVGQDTPTPAEQWDQRWWVIFNDLWTQGVQDGSASEIADRETAEQLGPRPQDEETK